MAQKTGYPSEVMYEEWLFVLPYLLLCREHTAQREYELRAVFNAVRYIAKTGTVAMYAARPAAVARGVPADATA